MSSIKDVHFRKATSADVAAMAACQSADPANGANPRMAAYFERQHHPQRALFPRVGYVAVANGEVIGYIAGHLTTRHDCEGEIQYLFVAPAQRRHGVATALLRLLAHWFQKQGAHRVCVAIAADSPPEAGPFHESVGAAPIKKHWYAWEDIAVACRNRA